MSVPDFLLAATSGIAPPLAWTPFFDPLNVFHDWWFTLALPMAFCIALIYKAMRVRVWRSYWRQVLTLTVQIVVGMIAMSLFLFVLVQFIVPALPAE